MQAILRQCAAGTRAQRRYGPLAELKFGPTTAGAEVRPCLAELKFGPTTATAKVRPYDCYC